jgi:site-specific DNA recombinase
LVSESDFLKANAGKRQIEFRTRKTEINPQLPLKNMIWCEHCNRGHLTGYLMKKRAIWYYKCSRKNCRTNRRAEIMHDKFRELLTQYSISSDQAGTLEKLLAETYEKENRQKKEDLQSYRAQVSAVKGKLAKVQDKFISDEITKDVYDSFTEKLLLEKIRLEDLLAPNANKRDAQKNEFIEFALKLSQELVSIWDMVIQRRKLI